VHVAILLLLLQTLAGTFLRGRRLYSSRTASTISIYIATYLKATLSLITTTLPLSLESSRKVLVFFVAPQFSKLLPPVLSYIESGEKSASSYTMISLLPVVVHETIDNLVAYLPLIQSRFQLRIIGAPPPYQFEANPEL
jgi:hypothetical protein